MPIPFEVNKMLADTFEPKRANRFLFEFTGDLLPAFTVRTMAKPSYTTETITIDYLNQKRYLAGKGAWNTIEMTLYDPIAPSSAQKVMEWVRLQHETISGRDGYAAFYKKNITLKGLDPVGAEIESWELRGCYCESVNFGGYDMSSAEALEISITIRPDSCILNY